MIEYKVKSRREIVDAMERLYDMLKENKLPLYNLCFEKENSKYVIPITNTLDWVLGENTYLEESDLNYRSSIMLEMQNGEDD